MKKLFIAAVAGLAVLSTGCSHLPEQVALAATADCKTASYEPADLFSRTKDSVVYVETQDGLGSGFIVRHQDGKTLIVTNSHVANNSEELDLKLHDGTTVTGKLVGDAGGYDWEKWEDASKDIALIQVDKVIGKPIKINTQLPKVGDEVVVIGAPVGLEFSMSRGIVSGLRLDDQLLQTDAPINPGNSGGPIINKAGCLVGMSTFIEDGRDGLGFGLSTPVIQGFLKNPPAIALNPRVPVQEPVAQSPESSRPPAVNQAPSRASANCWYLDNEEYVPESCKISSRTNVNGHTVWDVVFPGTNKIAIVLWDNNEVEYFFEGERYVGSWEIDEDGDTRIYSGDTSFIFRA